MISGRNVLLKTSFQIFSKLLVHREITEIISWGIFLLWIHFPNPIGKHNVEDIFCKRTGYIFCDPTASTHTPLLKKVPSLPGKNVE